MRKLSILFNKNNIPFVLIGAMVPVLLIDLREKNGSGYGIRPTKDLDYSIRVKSWKDYVRIKQDLMAHGFKERRGEPEHRLFCGNVPVDLLPYGKSIVKGDTLVWPQSGNRMSMAGFDKMFRFAQSERIDKDTVVPVAPLPLAVYSKILAYLDQESIRHLEDIIYMLEHYEEASVSERRFDVVGEKDLTYETSGAFLLGRDLKKFIPSSKLQPVRSFIELFKDEYSPVIREVVRLYGRTERKILTLFQAFQKGISR